MHVALDSESDAARLLAGQLVVAAEHLSDSLPKSAMQALRARLRELSVEVNLGVIKVSSAPSETPRARATTAREQLAALLADTAGLAERGGRRGLVVFLDEIQQAAQVDLVVIVNALQDALRATRMPIVVFAAGLPNAPDRIVEAASFGERFEYRRLEPLSPEQSERALLEPALQRGVAWQPDALELVLNEAKGSPYLLQLFGDEVWQIADPSPRTYSHRLKRWRRCRRLGRACTTASSAAAGRRRAVQNASSCSRWPESPISKALLRPGRS